MSEQEAKNPWSEYETLREFITPVGHVKMGSEGTDPPTFFLLRSIYGTCSECAKPTRAQANEQFAKWVHNLEQAEEEGPRQAMAGMHLEALAERTAHLIQAITTVSAEAERLAAVIRDAERTFPEGIVYGRGIEQ